MIKKPEPATMPKARPLPTLEITYTKEDLTEPAGNLFLEQGQYGTMLDFTTQACLKAYQLGNDPISLAPKLKQFKQKLITPRDKEIASYAYATAQARAELRLNLAVYLDTFSEDFASYNISMRLAPKN